MLKRRHPGFIDFIGKVVGGSIFTRAAPLLTGKNGLFFIAGHDDDDRKNSACVSNCGQI